MSLDEKSQRLGEMLAQIRRSGRVYMSVYIHVLLSVCSLFFSLLFIHTYTYTNTPYSFLQTQKRMSFIKRSSISPASSQYTQIRTHPKGVFHHG